MKPVGYSLTPTMWRVGPDGEESSWSPSDPSSIGIVIHVEDGPKKHLKNLAVTLFIEGYIAVAFPRQLELVR